MKRVLIVGAGPAGASAAYRLVRGGFDVTLIDKSEFPRYKTCGGGLTRKALNVLEMESCPLAEKKFLDVELTFLSNNLSFRVARKKPIIEMVMRDRFDEWLVERAVKAGVKFSPRCALKNLKATAESVKAETTQGDFNADFVVGADGALSAVAKAGGWTALPHLVPATEYEIWTDKEVFERFSERPRFDFESIPNGYGWVFPKADHLSIGVGTWKRQPLDLHAETYSYLSRLGIESSHITQIKKHGSVIPTTPRREGPVRGRVFLAGDAAGFADPITAEGISLAIKSGGLAADALIETQGNAERAGALYARLVKRRVLRRWWIKEGLSRFLYRAPDTARTVFGLSGQILCEKMVDLVQ